MKLPALLIILSLLVQMKGIAQQHDTSYRSTYYEQKVTLFRLMPDTRDEIIFLGNSITDIGEWTELWGNANVKNRGISGDNTYGILARLDEVLASAPAKIFIMIGINDIAKETPDSIIIRNYYRIVERIKLESPGTRIFVQSILPTNADFTEFKRHQNKTGHILAINAELKKMCSEKEVAYVDLYSRFTNSDGKLDPKYTNDGLHINGYGYLLWKQVLTEKGYMK